MPRPWLACHLDTRREAGKIRLVLLSLIPRQAKTNTSFPYNTEATNLLFPTNVDDQLVFGVVIFALFFNVPSIINRMFSYIVGFVAFLVLFYNPLTEILSPGTPRIRRTPLPQINTDLLALEDAGNETSIQCPEDSYSIHVFSREPLVLYIEGFLRPEEQTHLLDIRFV